MEREFLDYEVPWQVRPKDRSWLLALTALSLAVVTTPCCIGTGIMLRVIPPSVFNSVDVEYRRIYWNGLATLPAVVAFLFSCFTVHRVFRLADAGLACFGSVLAVIISGCGIIGGLLGFPILSY